MHSSPIEFWLYIVDFMSMAAGILLFFVYWRMKDMAFMFAAVALIGMATLSALLPAWWPLATGWLIAFVLIILISGAYTRDRSGRVHGEYY
jgi:hypothetical protein